MKASYYSQKDPRSEDKKIKFLVAKPLNKRKVVKPRTVQTAEPTKLRASRTYQVKSNIEDRTLDKSKQMQNKQVYEVSKIKISKPFTNI